MDCLFCPMYYPESRKVFRPPKTCPNFIFIVNERFFCIRTKKIVPTFFSGAYLRIYKEDFIKELMVVKPNPQHNFYGNGASAVPGRLAMVLGELLAVSEK